MTTQRRTLFKVVDKKTRRGTNFAIAKQQGSIYKLSPYIKIYKKGNLVIAEKGSLGIFTFKTKETALRFVNNHCLLDYIIILRVKPIGKGKTPKGIAVGGCTLSRISEFYSSRRAIKTSPPRGTICYPAVRVLN